MRKQSTLDDHASIYSKRDDLTERQKWDQMTKREKWQYFKDYYLLKLTVLVLGIIFICYVLYTTFGPRDVSELYGMVLNDQLDSTASEEMLSDFREALDISEKGHTFILDDSYSLDAEDPDVTTLEKIVTYSYSEKIDIFIADEDTIKYLAENGYLTDLTQIIPSDLYSTVTDSLIFAQSEEDTSDVAYGISLEHSTIYKDISYNYQYDAGKKMAIGIVRNTTNRDNAVSFIKYLLTNQV